jgi:uncharacterized spore protein YtfJ
VLRISGRQAGGKSSTRAGQKVGGGGKGAGVIVDTMATLIFRRAFCNGISAIVP